MWQLRPGERLDPFVAVWPRGGGKSTSVELACAAVAARKVRRYALYVSETQDQANQHVENVASLFESGAFGDDYAHVSQRLMGKFGNQRGWRVSRLRTASGFTIDAIGLDKSARGIKVDDQRPDLIILDDIDDNEDTIATIEKKLRTLTRRILPTRGEGCAFIAVQNLVHADGVFARLVDGRADFLGGRTVSGPHYAIDGLAYESYQRESGETGYRIIAGTPTWRDLAFWQGELDEYGLSAFLSECQHDVTAPDGGMFSHLKFRHIDEEKLPDLLDGAVWIDPAVTDTDHSDACGVSAASLGTNGVVYFRRSWEQRSSPLEALKRGIRWAIELGIDRVGVETDQGGDTWHSVYQQACYSLGITLAQAPRFVADKAGAGYGSKVHRAGQMLADYERGKIVHVVADHDDECAEDCTTVHSTHATLERALRRFPKTKPYDLCLAAGTMVEMDCGPVPIEEVRTGGYAWTRQGLRPVRQAGLTNSAAPLWGMWTEDGHEVVGTAEHPVLTSRGWIPLSGLRIGDIITVWNEKPSPLMASPTIATPTLGSGHIASTTAPGSMVRSIGQFMKTHMGRSLREKSGTYTTPTATLSTTTLPTLNWCTSQGMRHDTIERRIPINSSTWPPFDRWRPSGTEAPRGTHGTSKMGQWHGPTSPQWNELVDIAANSSSPKEWPISVRGSADGITLTPTLGGGSKSSAVTAGVPSSGSSITGSPRIVQSRVQTVRELGRSAAVFNLSVEGVPEYFANGVLVHNCDASFWAWNDLRSVWAQTQQRRGLALGKAMPLVRFEE